MRILVVDDEAVIGRLCQLELEEEGYTVLVATTGDLALSLFASESPHLVTLDLKMSRDDEGVDLLNEMKGLRPEIPIVVYSAFDRKDDFPIEKADAYLTKSSDLTNLKKTIRRLLHGKKRTKT
jgi:DNA-binding response OmpR family regulator